MRSVKIRDFTLGEGADRLTIIAGPCVVEGLDLCRHVARFVHGLCDELGFHYVFKASFDKANRTSIGSFRSLGMEKGLEILSTVRRELGVPVLTDIHEAWQAEPASKAVDVLQIPAFLCRQTDLLVAAGETGLCVNVKKGQFLAPWDMANVVHKIEETGNHNILLTERGVSFGYNTLVVDMYALPQMRELGYPVCFDATHSAQQPGAAGEQSGGRRDAIPYLARAAAGVGVDALFMEVHPEPEKGLSDAATMFRLSELPVLLRQIRAIDEAVRHAPDTAPNRG